MMIFLSSCKKNGYSITDRSDIEGKSLVKLGLFSMRPVATNILIYNNGERISAPIAAPYPYPGGGFNTGGNSNGDYFALEPGENKFELFTTNTGTANLIAKLFETSQTLEANKRYTVYIADTASNTVAVLAPDDFTTPDSGFSKIRFINLVPNSTAVDFYKGNTLIQSNIAYKQFTDFFDIPSSTIDTFSFRVAGSSPGPAITATGYYRFASNNNQRIHSYIARGYLGFPNNSADLRRPTISISVNQ